MISTLRIVGLIFLAGQCLASGSFTASADIINAYNYTFELDFQKADAYLTEVQAQEPSNLLVHYVADVRDSWFLAR